MNIIDIIKPVIMKRISLVLVIALAAGFAVTPRSKTTPVKDKPDAKEIKIELKEPDKVDKGDKRDDHFDDADSNGVNDQREDDFRNIKELKSKHKDKDRDKDRDKEKEPAIRLPEIKIAPKKKTR